MSKKIFYLVFSIVVCVLLVGGIFMVMIRIKQTNNSQQMIQAIENQDYDSLSALCAQNISGIDCASTYSVFLNTVFDGGSTPTPLEAAISCNDAQAVQILLDAGADPDKNSQLRVSTGQIYPLERGIANGNYQIVELLILHGADARNSAQAGLNALVRNLVRKQSVSIEDFIKICDLLEAQQGVSLSWNDLLFAAAVSADTELMLYLVQEKQADMQSTDDQGRTVLHLCILSGKVGQAERKAMVSLCLAQGTDVNAHDNQSKTAYDYAVERGYDEIAKLIAPAES